MKKKLLSLALALTLCLSLTVPAFAEEEDKTDPDVTAAENGETEAGKDEGTVGTEGNTDLAPAEGEDAEAPAEGEDAEAPAGDEDAEAPAENENAGEPAAPVNPFSDVAETSPFYQAILWAVDQGITNGTSDTAFSPSQTCTVRQILTFLYRANGRPGAAEGQSDLDAACAWGVEKGMIRADEDTSAPCTRALAVTFLWQAAGSPAAGAETAFADVAAGADYAAAVAWAVENGVTAGTSETTFSPDNTCTRGQIVTFLYRAAAK